MTKIYCVEENILDWLIESVETEASFVIDRVYPDGMLRSKLIEALEKIKMDSEVITTAEADNTDVGHRALTGKEQQRKPMQKNITYSRTSEDHLGEPPAIVKQRLESVPTEHPARKAVGKWGGGMPLDGKELEALYYFAYGVGKSLINITTDDCPFPEIEGHTPGVKVSWLSGVHEEARIVFEWSSELRWSLDNAEWSQKKDEKYRTVN
jgi:hypothetical protein